MLEMASCIGLSCVVLVDGDKKIIFFLAMSHSVRVTLALARLVGVSVRFLNHYRLTFHRIDCLAWVISLTIN